VCGDCNSAIGDIERALLRYTYVWFFRQKLGIEGYKRKKGKSNPLYMPFKDLRLKL